MWSHRFRPDKSASPERSRGRWRGTPRAAGGFLPCPAGWHGATFFQPQTQLSHPQPDHRPTHRDTIVEREPFAQLGYRQVRMRFDQGGDPGRYFRGETALRTGPVAHPLRLPARLPLAEDLLHISKTYAEYSRQLPEAAMPLGMRLEYLAPQIVLVGSRHPCFCRRVSPLIHYIITDIALVLGAGRTGGLRCHNKLLKPAACLHPRRRSDRSCTHFA
jgi:hypothetical protein